VVRVLGFLLLCGAVPVILYGAGYLAAAGVEAYNVAFRGAQVGDEVIPGHPAVPLKISLIQAGIGAVIVAVGLLASLYARRLLSADS